LAAATAILAFAPAGVEATPIPLAAGTPKQSLAIPGVAETTSPGTLLNWLTTGFTINKPNSPSITGTFITAVYRNAAGFIDFYYQIANTSLLVPNSDQGLSGVTGYNFGSAATSVGYYIDHTLFGGIFAAPNAYPSGRPLTADRTADGNRVTMWFGPPWGANKIHPGETSAILLVATNARNYVAGWADVQNTSYATVRAFQIPEPATMTTVLMGLALLAGARRRQRA
jgi:hypothetical protein